MITRTVPLSPGIRLQPHYSLIFISPPHHWHRATNSRHQLCYLQCTLVRRWSGPMRSSQQPPSCQRWHSSRPARDHSCTTWGGSRLPERRTLKCPSSRLYLRGKTVEQSSTTWFSLHLALRCALAERRRKNCFKPQNLEELARKPDYATIPLGLTQRERKQ
jgi:hypothetical protein